MGSADTNNAVAELVARLCEVRDNVGLSTRALAERLGVPQRTAHNYLSGRGEPSAAFLLAVVLKLGVSPEWLLLGRREPMRAQEGEVDAIREFEQVYAEASEDERAFLRGSLALVRQSVQTRRKQEADQ